MLKGAVNCGGLSSRKKTARTRVRDVKVSLANSRVLASIRWRRSGRVTRNSVTILISIRPRLEEKRKRANEGGRGRTEEASTLPFQIHARTTLRSFLVLPPCLPSLLLFPTPIQTNTLFYPLLLIILYQRQIHDVNFFYTVFLSRFSFTPEFSGFQRSPLLFIRDPPPPPLQTSFCLQLMKHECPMEQFDLSELWEKVYANCDWR